MSEHTDISLDDLLLADADERTSVLEDWNATDVPLPELTVVDLFSRQAEQTPDALAVVYQESSLTYAELAARSEALAVRLKRAGVEPGALVGIVAGPSVERIIAVMGVLRAGAAYVPFDESYPASRLRFMLEDTGASVLLGVARPKFAAGSEVAFLSIDGGIADEVCVPVAAPSPADLAYVIYTSGSTGRPKGVLLGHRGLTNRLLWMQRYLAVQPVDRVLHKTAFGFDVSVWELLLPLISGATLVIAGGNAQRDPDELVRTIQAQSVTVMHFVPSLLEAFLEEPSASACSQLRSVVCSGETLTPAVAERFFQVLDCDLYNLYGPTEATIDVTAFRCVPNAGLLRTPIGRPIDNTQAYILDERMQPVPVGATGDLWIGGVGVAQGYLNRADLTRERFVPNPFRSSSASVGLLYKTGDLAAYGAEGDIEFLGRSDQQVKLRGFRIELGEIEARLSQHPAVIHNAVVLREEGGRRSLAAYVVSSDDELSAQEGALSRHLAEELPEYMVPAAFVFLSELPRNASGKIDRNALPAPSQSANTPRAFVAPSTKTELVLAQIWSELLGIEDISVHDHFLRIGGDSISSIRVAARARTRGLEIAVKDVFERPTLFELASVAKPVEASVAVAIDPDAALTDMSPSSLGRRLGRDVEDVYPLAPMQSGLLFRGLYWPGSDSYFNQNVLELTGDVDADAIGAAWQAVLDHYPILRTGFVWDGVDEPLQYVVRHVKLPYAIHDLRAYADDERQAKLEALLREDRERGFDLTDVPLLRLQLIRLSDERYHLLWSHHHVLLDGWCLALIWGNVFNAYAQIVNGDPVKLAPSRPYRDYIGWLRTQEITGAPEAFWRERLRGFEAPTQFSPRTDGAESEFDTREFLLSEEDTAALGELARRQGITMNTLVQAAWGLLVRAQSQSDDIIFGASVSGRPPEMEGVESMVGLFINTIPLRVRIDPAGSLSDLFANVQAAMVSSVEHAHVPLAQIKAWSEDAHLDGGPLFDSLIAFENYPEENLPAGNVAGVNVKDLFAVEKTEYPIGLIVLPGERLALHVNYDTSHFSLKTVERIGQRLENIFQEFARAPDQPVSELSLMGAEERAWMENAGRGETVALGVPVVHRLFERRVEETPGALAVIDGHRRLTFSEVNVAANQLARSLRALGVRDGDPVAIQMGRSAEWVVALLATLKAGGACLPLAPEEPSERALWMLKDSDAKVVLHRENGDGALEGGLPSGCRRLRVALDDPPVPTLDGANLLEAVDASETAYVMYTSGTTGRPKGVLCTHRGLVNRLNWAHRTYRTTAPPVLLAHARVGFDISLWEAFHAICAGGTVVTLGGAYPDMEAVISVVRTENVSVIHFVPSVFDLFLRSARAKDCRSLEHVVCGGEALVARQCRNFRALEIPAVLHHAYGPTEASISVTNWQVDSRVETQSVVPIGRPIDNVTWRALDAYGKPVPVGVPGELWLGGQALARGYLNQEALTEERFVSDRPDGGRFYRTGDWVRCNEQGELEFVGRRDDQVKIRGHRVELAEVDAVLSEHPRLMEAAAVVVQDDGAPRLVAGAVPSASLRPDEGKNLKRDIQTWLGARLSAAAVPARIHWLERLPLSANGKLDRQALERQLSAAPLEEPGLAPEDEPRNELEAKLQEVWASLFGVERVGIHDNFFELGGHSLLMLRMVSEMRGVFGDELPMDITQVFKAPTIAQLSERVSRKADPSQSLVKITAGEQSPLVLVHPGEGLGVAYRALQGRLEGPLYSIDNPRFGDTMNPFASVEEMAAAYVELITQGLPEGPLRLGGWSFGGLVALEMARQLVSRGRTVEAVLMLDTRRFGLEDSREMNLQAVQDDLALRGVPTETPEGKAFAFELLHSGRLASQYSPSPFAGRVLLLRAEDVRGAEPLSPIAYTWGADILPALEVSAIPGTHASLLEQPYLDSTVAGIAAAFAGRPQ